MAKYFYNLMLIGPNCVRGELVKLYCTAGKLNSFPLTVPITSKVFAGLAVPIPTFPLAGKVLFCAEALTQNNIENAMPQIRVTILFFIYITYLDSNFSSRPTTSLITLSFSIRCKVSSSTFFNNKRFISAISKPFASIC